MFPIATTETRKVVFGIHIHRQYAFIVYMSGLRRMVGAKRSGKVVFRDSHQYRVDCDMRHKIGYVYCNYNYQSDIYYMSEFKVIFIRFSWYRVDLLTLLIQKADAHSPTSYSSGCTAL